ncbi:hypothetical protein TNCV_2794301 [Trichonephila clavipes]|nr:hypothetical protein TNCV_2794301 [Trichonephila clavipes]
MNDPLGNGYTSEWLSISDLANGVEDHRDHCIDSTSSLHIARDVCSVSGAFDLESHGLISAMNPVSN